jgi:hypothetical protein
VTVPAAGYVQRLRTFWFPDRAGVALFLRGLPALYFAQTTVHEGAHALMTWFSTGRFPKIAPFPHVTPDGRFLNGVTMAASGLIAAPQVLDLALIIGLSLAALWWPLRDRAARFLLRFWLLGASVDLLYNTVRELAGGHNRFADWSRFQDRFAIPDGWMMALTWLIWLIVLSHLVWVYFSAWGRLPPESGRYQGAIWILCLLSLAATVTSLAVSDPRIVKAHVGFVAPLAAQVLSLAWNGASLLRGKTLPLASAGIGGGK